MTVAKTTLTVLFMVLNMLLISFESRCIHRGCRWRKALHNLYEYAAVLYWISTLETDRDVISQMSCFRSWPFGDFQYITTISVYKVWVEIVEIKARAIVNDVSLPATPKL